MRLKRDLIELNDKRLDSLANTPVVILRYKEFVGDEKIATSHCGCHLLFSQKIESCPLLLL